MTCGHTSARLGRRTPNTNILRRLAALALLALCSTHAGLAAAQNQAPEAATGRSAKQGLSFRHQGVAAANPLAVEAGYAMLRQGGSAIDAAIATQLVLGLVEPQSSGLGGGAFIVLHDAKTGRTRSYDGRETAPAAAKPERFIGSDGLPLKFARHRRAARRDASQAWSSAVAPVVRARRCAGRAGLSGQPQAEHAVEGRALPEARPGVARLLLCT